MSVEEKTIRVQFKGDAPSMNVLALKDLRRWRKPLAVAAVALSITLAGCTADPGAVSASPSGESTGIPTQEFDQTLHDQLPAKIRDSGKLIAVNSGSYPPYVIINNGAEGAPDGLLGDMSKAVSEILGVKVEHNTVAGLASVLGGMDAGRYDVALDPNGDYPDRHTKAKFVDYVQEHVLFAVLKGNPKQITSMDATCGTRVGVLAGGSAERVMKAQSEKCVAAGKTAVEVQSYQDSPQSILAVQSDRADAVFGGQGPLSYYVKETKGKLELAAEGQKNELGATFQGAVIPLNSTLDAPLLKAVEKLYANGTYDAIMTKWGLDGNKLDKPGINRSAEK